MTERDEIRGTYDAFADEYAGARQADDRELAVLDSFLAGVSTAARVLDAGCGQGEPVLSALRAHAADGDVVGVDFSQAQLRLAAAAVPDAGLVAGDLTVLPVRDDAFDAVTAVNAIIHVPLAAHQTVVDEFARVLAPGGRLLLSEAPEPVQRQTEDWLGEGASMTWHMAGADATRDQLRDAGFRITAEWPAPEPDAGEPPQPPFFEAVLDG